MTHDEMRVAIAEACGWTVVSDTLCNVIPDKYGDPALEPVAPLPDYPADLNAMHEAEKSVPADLRARWMNHLCAITGDTFWDTNRATAAQRCEAFCRVMFPDKFNTLNTTEK